MNLVTHPVTVLLSGGQDSTTCLYWAKHRFKDVIAVSFDYGQRHRVELECAAELAIRARVDDYVVIPVEALGAMGFASLTNELIQNDGKGRIRNTYAESRGLPPSFVPGRNVVFFALAAAWGAAAHDSRAIVTGVCAQDRAGYPDCREEFVRAQEKALGLALDIPDFEIHAPLLLRTKAQTWMLADQLGVLDLIRHETNTCYEGDRDTSHEWGFGCGTCGACVERARGYDEWKRDRIAMAR